MEFAKLFEISINHEFFDGACETVDCIPISETPTIIKSGRLRSLQKPGAYSLYYQRTNEEKALVSMTGKRLLFALKANSSSFSVVSEHDENQGSIRLFTNRNDASTLTETDAFERVGSRYVYYFQLDAKPLNIKVLTLDDEEVQSVDIEEDQASDSFTFLFAQWPENFYKIVESDGDESKITNIAYLQQLPDATSALISIAISEDFYSTPPEFRVQFSTREEILKYYILASNYSTNDLSGLSLIDNGFNEQARSEIVFDRIESANFSENDIAPDLLLKDDATLILFKSQSLVGRKKSGPQKLQLHLNNEVLIASLPTPGSNRVKADFFIHVAKP